MKSKKIVIAVLTIMCMLTIFFLFPEKVKANDEQTTPYEAILYGSDNGVTTGEANTVYQTSDGYIWIGGYGGLQKYDGVSFETISGTNGLTSYSIRSLYETSDGILWVGSNEKGAFYLDNGEFIQPNDDETTKHRSVRCFMEDSFGRIWIGSSDGIGYIKDNKVYDYDLKQFVYDDYSNGYNNSTFYTLSLNSEGILFGVDYTGNVVGINTNDITQKPVIITDFGGSWAYSALVLEDDSLYVGTNSSMIYHITNPGKDNETRTSFDAGELSSVNSICETAYGEIWFCGDTGLGMIDEDGYHDYSYLDNTEHLVYIHEDYEHNIWLASSKYGVIHIRKTKISKIAGVPEINDVETYTITKYNDRYYVGTEIGLLVFDNKWNKLSDPLCTTLDGIHIHHIVSGGGKLYIGTFYNGIYVYDESTDTVENITGLKDGRVRCLLYTSSGKLVVGTNKSLEIIEGTEIKETISTGIMILNLEELNDGSILAGTDGDGIYRLRIKDSSSEYVQYAGEDSLSGGVVLRIKKDSNSDNIFVSSGYNMFYGSDVSYQKVNLPDYGSGSVVDFFIEDDKVWIFRASGIICAKKSEILNNSKEPTTIDYYSGKEGVPGPLPANSFNYYDGEKFAICTVSGIGLLDENNIYKNTVAPKAEIASIIFSDGSTWDGSDSVTLNKKLSKLTINLSALTYTGTDVGIEYWLEGFDEGPTLYKRSEQHSVEYTNLSAGTYTFRYRTLNSDGVYSSEKTITFVKAPRFQETFWFPFTIMLESVAVVFVIFFVITKIRIKQIKKKEEEYKKITDETISTVTAAIDAKDPYTEGHSKRVADFSVKIARKYGIDEETCERLYYIALLHDIGKIGVPDSVLKKPERLNDEEYQIIKQHTTIGGEILKNFTMLEGVSEGAKYHHEKYDGTGYPNGLKGEEIPLFARIIAVADTFDAMNSSRCYRKALDLDIIISEIEKNKGRQFDPELADVAIEILKEEHPEKVES
ncbi:MAG: HD domain-containing protein [Gammaproteobacteria bacterium]|nr:HD domain-containing protein [Gammaproteobacteria bacterium]